VVPGLLEWLAERQVEAFVDPETAASMIVPCCERPREELPRIADLLIVLGGDGTLLATSRLENERGVPILPVNLGGLGFLTSVTLSELYPILEQVLAGNNRTSERVMLDVSVLRGEREVERHHALNDAVLNKAALARMIDITLTINGEFVSDFRADGLIISTPTGSTAYSLAAGGPVLMPSVQSFVVTPVCPHSLTHRPLVVTDKAQIELRIETGAEEAFLSIDGQVGMPVQQGDRLLCRRAQHSVKLLRVRRTFFDALRNKLKWGQR
jgi:NAD+ kinase